MDDMRHSRDSRHGKFRERPHFPAIPAPLMKGRDAAGSKSSPGVKIDAAKLIPPRLNTSTHVERDRSYCLVLLRWTTGATLTEHLQPSAQQMQCRRVDG